MKKLTSNNEAMISSEKYSNGFNFKKYDIQIIWNLSSPRSRLLRVTLLFCL